MSPRSGRLGVNERRQPGARQIGGSGSAGRGRKCPRSVMWAREALRGLRRQRRAGGHVGHDRRVSMERRGAVRAAAPSEVGLAEAAAAGDRG